MLAIGLSILLVCAAANAQQSGSVCIAPFSKSAGDAAAGKPLTNETTFTFHFGRYETVSLKQGETKTVSTLPAEEKFLVRVLRDGKPHEAFSLDLRKFKARQVCMWLHLPYITWQADDYAQKGHGCNCF